MKTSQEWQLLYLDVKVLDPDGWDRTNFIFSWYDELISEEEYFKRRDQSTCIGQIK